MSTREKHPDRVYNKSLIGECAYWRKMLVEIYALHSSASQQVAVRDYFNKIHLGYPRLDNLEFLNPDPPPSKTCPSHSTSNNDSAEYLSDETRSLLKIGDLARLFDPEAARFEAIAQLKNNSFIQAEAKKELSRDKSIRKEVKKQLVKDKDFYDEVKEKLMEDDDLRDEVKEELMKDDDLRAKVKEELKKDDDLRDEVKEELMKDDDLNLDTNLDAQSIRTYF